MRIRKTLTIMLAALTMVACNKYDDSELREQVNKNTEALQNLQTLMNTNDYITGVTPVMEGGVEIGYTITFLKSQPITIYNGQKGQDGDSLFSSVDTSNPEYVVFTLTDGTQFTVPRYMGIKLEFDITDIKLGSGDNIDINITAEGSTDFTPDNFFVVTPDGWKNSITKTADPGKEFTLNLTSPADKDSEGEVLVMLDNKQGNTTIGRIKVDSKSTYLVIKDATAGKIAEAIREHDMEYIVASGSFNKTDWDAIAAKRKTLLHLDLENCTYEGGNGEDLIYFTFGSQNIPLKTLRLPQNITKIGETAFGLCVNLTDVKLPDGLMSIGEDAFYNCSALTCIKLPEGLKEIKNKTFYGCRSLTNITFPDGLESIELGACWECNLLTTITFPQSMKTINDAFSRGCTSLTTITCLAKTPPSLTLSSFPFIVKVIYVPAVSVETYKATSSFWSRYADKITAMP